MSKSKNFGKIAYEGYHTTRHRDYEKGWSVTPFNEITQGEKENWNDAADAVWDVCQADAGRRRFRHQTDDPLSHGDVCKSASKGAKQCTTG